MHQRLDAGISRRARNVASGVDMDRFEILLTALEEKARQVDRGLGTLERLRHLCGIADIAAHQLDLADRAHGRKEVGIGRMAHRDADAIAGLCQRAHRMPPQKPRTAEYRDDLIDHGRENPFGDEGFIAQPGRDASPAVTHSPPCVQNRPSLA